MKNLMYSLSDGIERYYSHNNYLTSESSEDSRVTRMKRLIASAMKNELTERQRTCIIKYYYDGLTVPEIAEDLGVKPTTVYKHLKLAMRSLKRISEYF